MVERGDGGRNEEKKSRERLREDADSVMRSLQFDDK